MVGCSVLLSLAAGIFSFCSWGAPHPLPNHRYQASTKRCHCPPFRSTVPSVTRRYVHAPNVITHRNKKTPLKKKANQAIKKIRTKKRTMPLPYGRGRYLYNCQSLCVYLTHSHLSAERERGIPATASDHSCPGLRGAATVVCPEAGRGGEGKSGKPRFAGITGALSHGRWLRRLPSYTLTQEEQDKPFSNYVKALDCGFNSR